MQSKEKGCYIATAVYGSYNAPQVLVLRNFRDVVLNKSVAGRIIINVYYKVSPPLAQILKRTFHFNMITRWFLDKFVNYLINDSQ